MANHTFTVDEQTFYVNNQTSAVDDDTLSVNDQPEPQQFGLMYLQPNCNALDVPTEVAGSNRLNEMRISR
jgi:hypothetical protein